MTAGAAISMSCQNVRGVIRCLFFQTKPSKFYWSFYSCPRAIPTFRQNSDFEPKIRHAWNRCNHFRIFRRHPEFRHFAFIAEAEIRPDSSRRSFDRQSGRIEGHERR